jgi:hypothetical protein
LLPTIIWVSSGTDTVRPRSNAAAAHHGDAVAPILAELVGDQHDRGAHCAATRTVRSSWSDSSSEHRRRLVEDEDVAPPTSTLRISMLCCSAIAVPTGFGRLEAGASQCLRTSAAICLSLRA